MDVWPYEVNLPDWEAEEQDEYDRSVKDSELILNQFQVLWKWKKTNSMNLESSQENSISAKVLCSCSSSLSKPLIRQAQKMMKQTSDAQLIGIGLFNHIPLANLNDHGICIYQLKTNIENNKDNLDNSSVNDTASDNILLVCIDYPSFHAVTTSNTSTTMEQVYLNHYPLTFNLLARSIFDRLGKLFNILSVSILSNEYRTGTSVTNSTQSIVSKTLTNYHNSSLENFIDKEFDADSPAIEGLSAALAQQAIYRSIKTNLSVIASEQDFSKSMKLCGLTSEFTSSVGNYHPMNNQRRVQSLHF